MKKDVLIRLEETEDYKTSEDVIRESFYNVHSLGCVEHYMLKQMRNNKDFIPELSFVAIKNNKIVGYIASCYCYVKDQDKTTKIVTFGPIGVLPRYQHKGIAKKLILTVCEKAKQMDIPMIIIFGNICFYSHFGFSISEKYGICLPNNKFHISLLAKPLTNKKIKGQYFESEAYEVNEQKAIEYDNTLPYKRKIVKQSQKDFSVVCKMMY